MQLQATPNDVPLQRSAADVTSALARATGHSSVSSLYSEHLSALLAAATVDHAQWGSASPGWQLLQALLCAAGGAAGPGLERALPVLATVVQQEREAALRISALQVGGGTVVGGALHCSVPLFVVGQTNLKAFLRLVLES